MTPIAPVAVLFAAVLDLLVGEPPERVHPVALFGRVVAVFDRSWARPQLVGALVALALPLAAAGVAWELTRLATRNAILAAAVATVALFSTTSLRLLLASAREVIDATETDPDAARASIRALVGRDAADLSAGHLRSGAVESAAENLADGLVAPLAAFALGAQVSLAVGVAGAVWVKAINTLDSMLGYRARPVGTASARLDDAVMWVPARLSAVLLAVAALDLGAVGRAREWQSAPPSPNSGWPMATLAAIIDAELAKPGAYVLNPGAGLPDATTARRGVTIVGHAGVLAVLTSATLAVIP
jgi:adenosylcobinamide-phosphate synthase